MRQGRVNKCRVVSETGEWIMKKLAIATITAIGVMGGTAHAAIAEGTGAIALLGITAIPSDTIMGGTTFDALISLFGGGTGAFANVPILTPFSHLRVTAQAGSVLDFSSSFGTFAGLVTSAETTGLPTNRVVNVIAVGRFTPMGMMSGFDPGPMSVSFSATQTGRSSAISASYSFWSAASVVPEVATYATMLAGLGVLGAVVRRRRVG